MNEVLILDMEENEVSSASYLHKSGSQSEEVWMRMEWIYGTRGFWDTEESILTHEFL
jgi:hypothetical protein